MSKHNFDEQLSGSKVFRPWGHWTEGDTFIGKFSGTSEDNFGNTNYEFETEEVEFDQPSIKAKSKKGETVVLDAPKEGEIFVLNSCGSVEKAMEKCDIGDVIKVIYTGTVTLTKGKFAGKEAHTMKVMRAASNRPVKQEKHAEVIHDEDEDLAL